MTRLITLTIYIALIIFILWFGTKTLTSCIDAIERATQDRIENAI